MKRPLEKRGNEDFDWSMSIALVRDEEADFSYPVFTWSFESIEAGISRGSLHAWPMGGVILVLQVPGESGQWEFSTVEDALSKIDHYGWGEPPLIDNVFQAMRDLPDLDFEGLHEQWERLLRAHLASAPSSARAAPKDWNWDYWERQFKDSDIELGKHGKDNQ